MKTLSIKTKLLVFLFISISCSFIILGLFNATNEYKSEYSLVKLDQTNLSEQTSKFIDAYLSSKITVVTSVAEMIKNENLNIENKILINQLMSGKKAGDFASMYIGIEENGDLVKFNGVLKSIATMNYDARLRPWYKKAMRIKSAGVSEPFVDNTTKRLVITVFSPYIKDNKLIGVIGANIFLDTVVKTILDLKLANGGFAYLLSNDGKILIHKDKKLLEKESFLFKKTKTKKDTNFAEVTENGISKLFSYSKIKTSSWYLAVEVEKDTIFNKIKENIFKEIALYFALLIAILGFVYFMSKKLLNPISTLENGLNDFFEYLKGKKDTVSILGIKTNDEFGNMGCKIDMEIETVKIGIEKDKLLIENVKEVVNKIKEGSLDVQVTAEPSAQSLNELKIILNDMIKTISQNVDNDINTILFALEKYSKLDFEKNIDNPNGKISMGLNGLCNIINEMLRENYSLGITLENNAKLLLGNVDILNRSSNETAASLEETSASLEEITTTIIDTTENISKMVNYSDNLVDSIKNGQELAKNTAESMNEINEQTTSIADAITVIDQIAFQTNILSLNAAVEAATAGEAGKGFAVVAQEVRNLASRSAEAAKEIKNLVENATYKTNIGKINADKMIDGYTQLNENIKKTTEIISDIENASNEQRVGIEQINDAVTHLDQRTQENASVANQTHEISTDTSTIAKNIIHNVNTKKFRRD